MILMLLAGDIGGAEARKVQRHVREAHASLRGPDGGEPEAFGSAYDGGRGVQGAQGRHREADDREPPNGDKVRKKACPLCFLLQKKKKLCCEM